VAFWLPASGASAPDRDPAAQGRARQVKDSLRVLGKAMLSYADRHDSTLPLPAVPLKPPGKPPMPGLSWRVQLLPYLGEEALYRQFKLAEPWDSPANHKLLGKMPKVFAAPRLPGAEDRAGYTFYQVFTKASFEQFASQPIFPNPYLAAWGQEKSPRLFAIADGTSNTLLIAEAMRAVPWTAPEDLHYARDRPVPALGHAVPGIVFVCLADGQVRALSKRAPTKDLRALITRAEGEDVRPDDLAPGKFPGAGPATGTVSGRVLFRGKPLSPGWVVFHARDEREFAGELDAEGNYRVADVPVGAARLAVVTVTERAPPLPGLARPNTVVLPRRYGDPKTSGLTLAVRRGKQVHDLVLD
jgi:hypothetical protein